MREEEEQQSQPERPPRFPLRWRWTMMMGLAMSLALGMLTWLILRVEHDAWQENQRQQAQVLVERLAESLKLPVLTRSAAEVEAAAESFMKSVPSAMAVHVEYEDRQQHFGAPGDPPGIEQVRKQAQMVQLRGKDAWFARRIEYNHTVIGLLAVRFSGQMWEAISSALLQRMLLLASVVLASALWLTWWIAGRMSRPLEMIAAAATRVANGEYQLSLPVHGNDEISDAAEQFNFMLRELRHKERMRTEFGRYLNPHLVSRVFENQSGDVGNHRQQVTILFADMVGFTAFSEGRDPEDIVDVLNRHFEVFHCVIDHFGGHVDKYIGDAVMAVFNHPKEDEQHSRHAVMAGLAMGVACRRLGLLRDDGQPIAFRVGINRGEVIVGNIGAEKRLEYTVIGDAVNRASRMGGLGKGGEVVLPRATFDTLGEGFRFEAMGDVTVKGVSQPIPCGVVRVDDPQLERDIAHAVALAFDLTLPADARQIIGEI